MPTTVSMMIAAIVFGPSSWIVCSRCSSARCDSSASVDEWNAERYRYGPKNRTVPLSTVSFAQRRGSPVIEIAVAVEPW